MKKIRSSLTVSTILTIIPILFALPAPVAAASTIPAGDVSGTWTAANSPYLFGRDLWSETRIPVFEQSVAIGGIGGPKLEWLGRRAFDMRLLFDYFYPETPGSVVDFSEVIVEGRLSASDLALVEEGQKARVTSYSYPDRSFDGTVSNISPTVDPETRTIVAVDVKRDAVCGCARYVAQGLVGVSVDEAEQQAGLLHHHYPCLASMGIDSAYGDTLMHVSGNVLKDNVAAQVRPFRHVRYYVPDKEE